MQELTRFSLMRNVNLTCVKSAKFKTACLSLNFLTPLDRTTASKSALLPKVLLRGTSHHPDMESLAAATDELYGAQISPLVRKKGEVLCIGFYADFADDDFVPRGTNVLENTAALLGELLLEPATKNGKLLQEYVDSERENLLDEIRSLVNNKRMYAMRRLSEEMCAGEKYGISKLGTESAAKKITATGLTKHYKELIASAPLEIFYCGNAEPQRVRDALENALSALPRSEVRGVPATELRLEPGRQEMRVVREQLDVQQGNLAIGFRMGSAMLSPSYPAIAVFNSLYGGSVTSRLFLNVREKMSLCYYAGSTVEVFKGVMLVSSGIEPANYDVALSEILRQLEGVKQGDFSDEELENARRDAITSCSTVSDDPTRLENFYLDRVLTGLMCSPEEFASLLREVRKQDVVRMAENIRVDTVYFLTGKEEA